VLSRSQCLNGRWLRGGWPRIGAQGPWGRDDIENVKEGVNNVTALAFGGARAPRTRTEAICAFAMAAVLRPKECARDTLYGLRIMAVEPRRVEKHHLRRIPNLSHEENIPLQRDDVACSGDTDEFVPLAPPFKDFAIVVTEYEFVYE
jgi:hypothetical protein